jgi:hypothetical protein
MQQRQPQLIGSTNRGFIWKPQFTFRVVRHPENLLVICEPSIYKERD